MRKRTVLAIGGILGSLVLAGCPGPGGKESAPPPETHETGTASENASGKDWGEPVPGGQLVARYIGDAQAFNPLIEESVAEGYVNDNIFPFLTDSLWANCDIGKAPMLATSWEWSDGSPGQPGGKTLTYHLRKDALWSDGEPITSADVVFSYDLYGNTTVASPRYGFLEKIASYDAPDPYTVVFHFTEHYPPDTQIYHTALGIVPKHLLGDIAPDKIRSFTSFNRSPVVAGPFKVTRMAAGSEYVLERCEECNLRPRAWLDRVVIRIIPEETTALVELKKGNIDYMELSTYDPIKDIRENYPQIRVLKRGYRFLDYIGWNTKDRQAIKDARAKLKEGEVLDLDKVPPHALFGDREVRRALTMAIDRQGIMEAVTTVAGETYGRVATGTVTPELCKDYADIQPLPYDPEGAARILASKGWRDTDGDGILDKDGRPFRFTINYNAGNKRRGDACVFIQSMLKQVGIQVDIQPIESSVFFGNLRKKDFDAALAGWSAALVIDPSDIWHSGAQFPYNFTSYSNPRADDLIERGVGMLDREARRKVWKELQEVIYDDQPYTFLYWFNGVALVHSRFQGVQSNILSAYYHLNEWWVPKELQKYHAAR